MTSLNFWSRLLCVLPLLLAVEVQAKEKGSGFECPKLAKKLTSAEVFEGRMAALRAGNIDLAFCYYAEDAVVVLPGSVVRGREAAKAAFQEFGAAFGGRIPEVSTLTIEGEVVLATFSIEGPVASVQDGADTFVIRDGRIQAQTVHATLVFQVP